MMDFFQVCIHLELDEVALRAAMTDPRFPKPSRVDAYGEPVFDADDIYRFARAYPDTYSFAEAAFIASKAKARQRRTNKRKGAK
ncbi:MAG TPA: hypothetical protein VGH13_21740 [Xanthobacteraceae bacterium]|jgi:hypothetical protein